MTRSLSPYAVERLSTVKAILADEIEGPAIRAAIRADLLGDKGNGNGNDLAAAPARQIDLHAPVAPVEYRVDRLAVDGCVTVLTGHGGEGKSWLALCLAIGVARGSNVAGLRCREGSALYIDGENGERLIALRYRGAGGPREGVAVFEAQSLDLADPRHAAWLADLIHSQHARFVVLDSLRSLAPRLEESNGDTVAPVMASLRRIARATGAAIVLVHHRPKNTGAAYRGSSVLRDQADVLAVLGRHEKDPENATRRYLHADGARGGKFRIDAEPPERWLHLRRTGERITLEPAVPFGSDRRTTDRPPTAAERVADQMAEVLAQHPEGLSRPDLARAVGRPPDDGTVRRAVDHLLTAGRIVDGQHGWTLASHVGKLAGKLTDALPATPPVRGAGNGKATGSHSTAVDPDPELVGPFDWTEEPVT